MLVHIPVLYYMWRYINCFLRDVDYEYPTIINNEDFSSTMAMLVKDP